MNRVVLKSAPESSFFRSMEAAILEDLWFGDGDDDAAEEQASASLAALVAKVNGLRPIPAAARKLLELTRSESASVDEIVRVLEGDPMLTTRVLRVLNSSAFGLRDQCKSVRHAVTLLGAAKLGELAASAIVLDAFSGTSPEAAAILARAPRVAAVARRIAFACGVDADDVYTCALVHDIGKLCMLDTGDESYAPLLAAHDGEELAVVERATYGFDHAVLAGHLLALWKIPSPLPQVVAWQYQLSRSYEAGSPFVEINHVLRLANRIEHELAAEKPDAILLDRLAREESACCLELTRDEIELLWPDLRRLHRETQAKKEAAGKDPPTVIVAPTPPPIARVASPPPAIPKEALRRGAIVAGRIAFRALMLVVTALAGWAFANREPVVQVTGASVVVLVVVGLVVFEIRRRHAFGTEVDPGNPSSSGVAP